MALKMTMSFRMMAVTATLKGLPFWISLVAKSRKWGWERDRSLGRHIQAGSDLPAAGEDMPPSMVFAAVAVIRGKTSKGGGGGAWDMADFRHEGQNRVCGYRPDSSQGLHQLGARTQGLIPVRQGLDFPLNGVKLTLKRLEMGV